MKRTILLTTVMMMAMLFTSVNANASRDDDRDDDRTEYRSRRGHRGDRNKYNKHDRHDRHDWDDRDDWDDWDERYDHRHKPSFRPHRLPRGCKKVRCTPPRIKRGCYVPGWEGRVRYHHDGRWGYHVDGVWVYYNCYYDPYKFFCKPLPPRRPVRPHGPVVHVHHNNSGEVVAGAVAGAVIGAIIGSMAD